jgi:hypothetical protein
LQSLCSVRLEGESFKILKAGPLNFTAVNSQGSA